MLEKVDSYAKIVGVIEIKKKKSNNTADTFGISLEEFQFLLRSHYNVSVISCRMAVDEDFCFMCLMPQDEYIPRLKGLSEMLLKVTDAINETLEESLSNDINAIQIKC